MNCVAGRDLDAAVASAVFAVLERRDKIIFYAIHCIAANGGLVREFGLPGECCMGHLTLQEVIDRINKVYSFVEDRRAQDDRGREQTHRPEFYNPRITRRLARFMLST